MKSNNIDIVLLWVNSEDQEWRQKLSNFAPHDSLESNPRFRCWGALEFIFRGIESYIPWYGKIHFVTEGHLPLWLDTSNSRLNIVKHEDIIPKEHLPCFNSNAIEVNLSKIETLSENFILFNDDTFVLSKLAPERFFVKGKPVDFINQGIKRKGYLYSLLKRENLLSTTTINNNIEIINQVYDIYRLKDKYLFSDSYSLKAKVKNWIFRALYGEYSWFKLNHVPQPHLKSTFSQFWSSHYDNLIRTSGNRLRSKEDTTQYLFRYANLVTGRFFPEYFKDTLSININSANDIDKLKGMLNGISLLSITDSNKLSANEFNIAKKELYQHLSLRLPNKSSFEL